jgi:hypothetical protein
METYPCIYVYVRIILVQEYSNIQYVCMYVCMYVWFVACSITAVILQALHS